LALQPFFAPQIQAAYIGKKMIAKLDTAMWFLRRPTHWRHAADIARRKWLPDHDGPGEARKAQAWAAERAVPLIEVLAAIGLATPETTLPQLPPSLLEEAQDRSTRVAREDGRRRRHQSALRSDDSFVGIVVPERLRGAWEIIREPDRPGIKKAIERAGGVIDLCHYDSDKSWWGRQYGYPLLWAALGPGGIFISDDIQDNMAFANFVSERYLTFSVTEYGGKYIGIIRK
jgi:hypothetical protein